MPKRHLAVLYLIVSSCLGAFASNAILQSSGEKLDQFLRAGKLEQSKEFFSAVVAKPEPSADAQLALGITQFVEAIQYLGQSGYRFGLMNEHAASLPLARMPTPSNPDPDRLSYAQLRDVIAQFQQKVDSAEKTLAKVKTDNVKIPLYLGRIRLDLDGDQRLSDAETLWRIFAAINTGLARENQFDPNRQQEVDSGIDPEQAEKFYISADGADVHWLRGYCHFLMSVCDMFLAYDEQELFERCGQLLFPRIESPWRVTKEKKGTDSEAGLFDVDMILDLLAAVHLVNFKLKEPQRMKSAHRHLVAMIEQSRLSWQLARLETDDDNEWIPNPKQTGVLRIAVTNEMISGWHEVLDELEAILAGKKLVPYHRDIDFGLLSTEIPDKGIGINLHRFFNEPADFDLILAIQGTGVEPYLEEGELSTPEAWNRLTRVFQGEFFGFAIWFN